MKLTTLRLLCCIESLHTSTIISSRNKFPIPLQLLVRNPEQYFRFLLYLKIILLCPWHVIDFLWNLITFWSASSVSCLLRSITISLYFSYSMCNLRCRRLYSQPHYQSTFTDQKRSNHQWWRCSLLYPQLEDNILFVSFRLFHFQMFIFQIYKQPVISLKTCINLLIKIAVLSLIFSFFHRYLFQWMTLSPWF